MATLLTVALTVAGCGDDREVSPSSEAGDEASETAVAIDGFKFVPPELDVTAGSTVTWTNQDDSAHTIQDEGDAFPESQNLENGDSFSFTYESPGEYPYICGIHPYMKGTVSVS